MTFGRRSSMTAISWWLILTGSTLYLLNLCSKRCRDGVGEEFDNSSEETESKCSGSTDDDNDKADDNSEEDSNGAADENGKDYKSIDSNSNREYDIFHSQFTYCARIRAGHGPKKAHKQSRIMQKSVGSKEKGAQSKSKGSKILSKQDDKGLVKEQGNAAHKDEKGKEKRSPAEGKDHKKEQKQDKQKKTSLQRKGKPKETKHKSHEQKKGSGSVEKPKQKRSTVKSKVLAPKGKQGIKRSGEGGDKKKSASKPVQEQIDGQLKKTQPEELDKVIGGGAYYHDEGQDDTIEDAPSLKRIFMPPSE